MRKKMTQAARAKQFMPFAALKGYEEALRQVERMIEHKMQEEMLLFERKQIEKSPLQMS